MSEEKKESNEVVYTVATKDEVLKVTSAKLKKTIEQNMPCMVYTGDDVLRILKFRDRTSFEVRNQ